MKKKILILSALILIVFAPIASAASTTTQTPLDIGSHLKTITFAIVSDGSDFTVATSTANTVYINSWYLYSVTAYATGGAYTTPDAADVLIYDSVGNYLLGSEDAGTTAYQGLNLIQATGAYSCVPDMYIKRSGGHVPFFWPIYGTLTLSIKNQATADAYFSIKMVFAK